MEPTTPPNQSIQPGSCPSQEGAHQEAKNNRPNGLFPSVTDVTETPPPQPLLFPVDIRPSFRA